jgi:ABC-type transport system involved in multi-copper enzyme maturation permease subunit
VSVYKRTYQPYTGQRLPSWSRILVLTRYGFSEVWSSKITVALLVFSTLPLLGELFTVELSNNPMIRMAIGARHFRLLTVDANYFRDILQGHSLLALVMTAWIAPRLISFDLADNALPLLLSRPISRWGYLTGKLLVLFGFLSVVTWVPNFLLFAFQSYSSPVPWAAQNLYILCAAFFGSWIWIVFLSLLGLAMSAWVRWRIAATGLIFASILVPTGFGQLINEILRVKWGVLLNAPAMIDALWRKMLYLEPLSEGFVGTLSVAEFALSFACAGCLCLLALNKRIRAREVVRG